MTKRNKALYKRDWEIEMTDIYAALENIRENAASEKEKGTTYERLIKDMVPCTIKKA